MPGEPSALLALVAEHLPPDGHVVPPLEDVPVGSARAVLLLADELSTAGEHAERLVARAADALRPGGILTATAGNRVFAAATGASLAGRGYDGRELARLVEQRGFAVKLLCAPGAGARLRGDVEPGIDMAFDRMPGLLDAAPRLLIVARAPRHERERSERFFASLPRKVVAAAVVCRDHAGRILVVYDRFKAQWTIPGGVVDADEDPRDGAVRETWEEAGVRVQVGRLLGVFAASWPDRLVLVYAAEPTAGPSPDLAPVHGHEIGGAAWLEPAEALARVAPRIRYQVERCLNEPGGTWRG